MDLTLGEIKQRVEDITGRLGGTYDSRLTRWVNLRYQQLAREHNWKDLMDVGSTEPPTTDNYLALPYFVERVFSISDRANDIYLLQSTVQSNESKFVDIVDQSGGTVSEWSVRGAWPVWQQPSSGNTIIRVAAGNSQDLGVKCRLKGVLQQTLSSGYTKDEHRDTEIVLDTESGSGGLVGFTRLTHVSKDRETSFDIDIHEGTTLTIGDQIGLIPAKRRSARFLIIQFDRAGQGTGDTFHYYYKRSALPLASDDDALEIFGIDKLIIHGVAYDALHSRRRESDAAQQLQIYELEKDRVLGSERSESGAKVYPQATHREML